MPALVMTTSQKQLYLQNTDGDTEFNLQTATAHVSEWNHLKIFGTILFALNRESQEHALLLICGG